MNLETFISHINRQHLLPTGQEVLLAVSGGIDSVVLAHLMHSAHFPFAIAHCNFRLRPGESDRDETFVRNLADSYGVTLHLTRFDTADYAAAHRLGIEDAARRLRYEWFASLCRQHGYPALLTAHHADDAAETFFLNLLRGTGLSGLHGIRPTFKIQNSKFNLTIVRPLLPFSRADIQNYATALRLQHVDDSTNASLLYRRNRIRHQVIPLLREIQPSLPETMAATLDNLSSTEHLYHHLLTPIRNRYLLPQPDGSLHLLLADLLADYPTDLHLQLLFELLHPLGFNTSQRSSIAAPPHNGAQFQTPTHHALYHRGTLLITPLTTLNLEPETCNLKLGTLNPSQLPPDFRSRSASTAFFDADTLRQPLSLRHWREGDRFQPLGMQHGSQLLSDYFSDHHLSLLDKQRQLLLVDADDVILWIVGRRTSHPHRITSSTKTVLQVSV